MDVRSKVTEPDIGFHARIQEVQDYFKNGLRTRPKMEKLAVARERPLVAQIPLILIGEGKRSPQSHLAKIAREISPGLKSEIKRAPEFWVDLHQFVVAVARVAAKFDHRYTMPTNSIKHSPAIKFEFRIVKAFRARTDAACRG